jgi:SAM-dependent methyltransferase
MTSHYAALLAQARAERRLGAPDARRADKIRRMERLDAFRQRMLEHENRYWDERLGVDTRGWVVLDGDAVVSAAADGFPYAGTHWRLARAVLRVLRSSARGATFVDLGSGKGRVLLVAAELPFEAVVGVEYASALHAVAERNIAHLAADSRTGAPYRTRDLARVRSELGDVRDFEFPPTPLVIYLNNPFPESVLSDVLATLGASYASWPRSITIVYQQLRDEDAEHHTRNVSLIAGLEFVEARPLRMSRPLDRWLLSPYVISAFASSDAVA